MMLNAGRMNEKEKMMQRMAIVDRACEMGLLKADKLSALMDVESADRHFNMRTDEWLKADDFNFAHDFIGIRENINRGGKFPATDFGFFIPRFAGKRPVQEHYEVIDMTEFFTDAIKKSGIVEQAWIIQGEERKDLLIWFYPGIKQEKKNGYILAIAQKMADMAREEEKKETSLFCELIHGIRLREVEQCDFEIIKDPKYRKAVQNDNTGD